MTARASAPRRLAPGPARTADVALTLVLIGVLIAVTGAAAYASMFVGFNTIGCDYQAECNPVFVIVGWVGGLIVPPLVTVWAIVVSFRRFTKRHRATLVPLVALPILLVCWVLLSLIAQLGIPGFSLADLMPAFPQ